MKAVKYNRWSSKPVEILGLSGVPKAGEDVLVVQDERKAREGPISVKSSCVN